MSAERPSKLEIVGGHRPPLQFDPLRELSDTEVAGGRELEDCEYLQFLGRRKTQNVSFNPSCITRLLPDPTSGLPAATSGVAPPPPNPPALEGSSPRLEPFAAPYGLAIMG